ncbi:histidinol-phosphate aminotransferase [Hydrogenophaga crassostreae]|uniref:Histidinol-phosphate aminotransferase n=1 Tax=Hydrogenophaga crassostreae TaxID=1763535 RepID=A0A162VXR8_9BURK|nr:histidinol-phosphate transaminase [Hydrogenophaga crassostreae]AOW12273.1 histidinol-phosphate transaminase [Hydrogenophaga crassostreae]OAD41221.1 histidinol-phosphate aminotransferase [Hydrogenophaga crassostreae]
MNQSPMRFIRQDIQSMHAYAIQDSTGLIKLDAMENPFALPAELQSELGARLGALAINRYPGSRIDDLKKALGEYIDLPAGTSLMLGNGSDELISLLAMTCDVPGASILAPLPGFVMYAMGAQLQGLAFHGVPLTADFELDEAAMLATMGEHQPAITYIAYPNNPTANLWDAAVIRRLIAEAATYGGLVVMDEAYQPFSSRSWLDEIRAHPLANANVLLMRTLSKFGLAGVRLGYMVGPQALVHEVDKLRPPYNVSVLNAECALFALEHAQVFARQAAHICEQREVLIDALGKMPGVTAYPSDANMVLTRVPDAQRCFDGLKADSILVKNVSKMHPLLGECLRLTVGTPAENAQLIHSLQKHL